MSKAFSYIALAFFIAILALMLVPSRWWPQSPRLKEARRATACLSNLKQLSLATLLYAEANDENLPLGLTPMGPTAVGWAARIAPHLNVASHVDPVRTFREPFDTEFGMSYAINANVAAMPKLSSHSDPERGVLLFEVEGSGLKTNDLKQDGLRHAPAGDGTVDGLIDTANLTHASKARLASGALGNSGVPATTISRHGEKTNIVLVDGRARRLRPSEVSAGANARMS